MIVLAVEDVMGEGLETRRSLLEDRILSKLDEPIRFSPELDAKLPTLIQSIKAQGFEGLILKSRKSQYDPGLRSGAWQKMQVNQGQELVIGGYTPSLKNFDALVIGYYDNGRLMYAARTRNGFMPALRIQLFRKKTKAAGNQGMPVREPARGDGGSVECRTHGGENGRVSLAKTRAGGAV